MARIKIVDGVRIPLTPEEEAAIDAAQAEYASPEEVKKRALEETLDKRKKEYGSMGEQLDMLHRQLMDGTKEWSDHIATVKAKYPKEA